MSYAKTEVYLAWASYHASTVLALLLPSFLEPMCALAVVVESMDSSYHAYVVLIAPGGQVHAGYTKGIWSKSRVVSSIGTGS